MSHSFNVSYATTYGVNEAIIINHFQHWISVNHRLKRNYIQGRTWTYQSFEYIAAQFPYLTPFQVRNILHYLCTGIKRGSKQKTPDFEAVLIKGNFNKSHYDRTQWYAFANEEKFSIWLASQMEKSDQPNGKGQSATSYKEQILKTDTIREESKPKKSAQAPPAPSSSSKKIKRAENVATTEEENAKLTEKLGYQELQDCYRFLSEWKEDAQKSQWKKSDYRSILRWVIDAVREKKLKKQKQGGEDKLGMRIKNNRAWAQPLRNISFPVENQYIKLEEHCVFLIKGSERTPLGFAEAKFKEIILNCLQNWEIQIPTQMSPVERSDESNGKGPGS